MTVAQVTALGNLMRSSLNSRGCWLPDQVPLHIESQSGLAKRGAQMHELGRTEAEISGGRLVRQRILVRHGLPQEVCLFVLAHEYGHALLNRHGQAALALEHAEGFCQYLGGVVIREQLGHGEAAICRYQGELSRDGVYGSGMRIVTEAVDRCGEAAVIRAFLFGRTAALRLRRV